MKGGNMAEDVTNEAEGKKGSALESLSMGAWIGIAVAALVIGLLVGKFALGGVAGGALAKSTLAESELGSVVGTYTYNGKTESITAKEVIEQYGSLSSSKKEDGTYAVPSADNVLSLARNRILALEASNRGITVSDEDLAAYAEQTLGSSDFEQIATSYSMDQETVKELLRQSAQMSKMRDEVVGTAGATAPEAPVEPEYPTTDDNGAELDEEAAAAAKEQAQKESKKEYADYIIKLAGDEWDADKGAWKAEDGPYATALADYEVTADGASYEAAQAAYYVAYQSYSTAQSDVSTQWTDFVNGLFVNATVSLTSLVA
jgi:hypothetical protein